MLEVKNIKVYNFDNAIIGMRHPLQSYDKSDSYMDLDGWSDEPRIVIGNNDLTLMRKLIKAGTDHRKFMRQILVSFNVTAPLYWFKEAETYKVGTTSNSTSSMHTIHKNGITENLFSLEDIKFALDDLEDYNIIENYLQLMERLRVSYNEKKDNVYWRALIQLLPSSLNQTRMMTLNYEVLLNMYNSRKNHKLSEWNTFCKMIEDLPYWKELILHDE